MNSAQTGEKKKKNTPASDNRRNERFKMGLANKQV